MDRSFALYIESFVITIFCAIIIAISYPVPFSFIDDPFSDFGDIYTDGDIPNFISCLAFSFLALAHAGILFLYVFQKNYEPIYHSAILIIERILFFLMAIGFCMTAVPKSISDLASDIHRFGGFFTINIMLAVCIIKQLEYILVMKKRYVWINFIIMVGFFVLFYISYGLYEAGIPFITKAKMMQNIGILIGVISFWLLPIYALDTRSTQNPFPFGTFEDELTCEQYEQLYWNETKMKCFFKRS